MKKNKAAAFVISSVIAAGICLTGCKGESTAQNILTNEGTENAVIHNFEMPEIGEKIAVITIKDYGEIKIKLFPEITPKAVENFVGLSESGYYDELIFHRIILDFMMQGGDPRGDGTGGKSIWGENFDCEFGEGLYHFSGAVAYAHGNNDYTNGSQFYIVNTIPENFSLGGYQREDGSIYYYQTFEEAGYSYPANVEEMYREKSGTPHLDGVHTVFGQVFEGMDIVRQIGNVETDSNDKPLVQIQMESVKIVEYQG